MLLHHWRTGLRGRHRVGIILTCTLVNACCVDLCAPIVSLANLRADAFKTSPVSSQCLCPTPTLESLTSECPRALPLSVQSFLPELFDSSRPRR